MQSESGIVPDFEVGEEFHEEPKTYYELKSQPLKNRSVNGAFDKLSNACPLLHAFKSVACPEKTASGICLHVVLVILLV